MMIEILRGTPVWVFVVLAWLLWNGMAQLRDREIAIRRLWIMPVVFIVLGLVGLMRSDAALMWLLAGLIAMPFGFYVNARQRIDRARGRVWQAASIIPLLRNLLLFGAHYALQVAAAIQPAQHARIMNWDVFVSGLGAGYFLAWSIQFVMAYRSQPMHASQHGTAAS